MSLQHGAQVLVQRQRQDGSIECAAFRGLAAVNSSLVLIASAGGLQASADADRLFDVLLQEVSVLNPGVQKMQAPCGGRLGDLLGCHAHQEPSCFKLLVIVGDGTVPVPELPSYAPWLQSRPLYTVLPVFPKALKTGVTQLLPKSLRDVNADFWSASVDETIPSVLALSGLTSESPRIFISYRQKEASALAVQLFDALAHENFDVFLDHFRISAGLDFQVRLTQELGEKSMLLIVETPGILDSEWTQYEIGTAQKCALGIVALHPPGGREVPGVDEEVRLRMKGGDFEGGSFSASAVLDADALARVVERVKREHDRSLVRRRWQLRKSIEGALQLEGVQGYRFDEHGLLHVPAPNGLEYLIWLTPRPPDLPDFYIAHQNCQSPVRGVVIGLSRLMEPRRIQQTNWLAGVCELELVDEGKLLDAADLIARGAL